MVTTLTEPYAQMKLVLAMPAVSATKVGPRTFTHVCAMRDGRIPMDTLKSLPADQVTALMAVFTTAKLRVMTPGKTSDASLLLVVHADDCAYAEAMHKEFTAKRQGLSTGLVRP